MKNVQVTAKETRNGESLANADTRMTQGLYNILHQAQAAVAVERENGFGMELHTLDRQVAMADPHDDPVVALGGNFKTRWQFLRNRIKRVIPADAELLRESGENAVAAVAN